MEIISEKEKLPDISVKKKSESVFLNRLGKVGLYTILVLIALFQLFPIYWLALFSLKNNYEIFNLSPLAFPEQLRFENYIKVWTEGNIGTYFFNSVLYTVVSVVLTIVLASMVTFAITRLKWRFNKLVLGLFMLGLMIPIHSTLIPLFNTYTQLGLINHPLSLILSYTAFNLPVTIMILIGFYEALPHEIEEAAIIEGASIHQIFFRITLPMTAPVIATASIINMIYNWNEFVFVNTFISSDELKTLTVGIQNFIGQYATDWGAIGATLMFSVLPILIIFLILSDRIVEGIAAGSVKG